MKKYDVMIVGPVSLDHNIDCEGRERRELGGAVVASGFAAAGAAGARRCLRNSIPGRRMQNRRLPAPGRRCTGKPLRPPVQSATSISRRIRRSAPARRWGDAMAFSSTNCRAWRLRFTISPGLMTGDIDERMIAEAAGYGKVAVDVQGFLRCAGEDGAMTFRDWENKRLYLPHIDYLKTDAAEAEILTGVSDGGGRRGYCTAGAPRRCSSPTTRRCWPLTAARCAPAPSAPEISPGARAAETRLSPGTSRNASTEACPRRFFTAPRWCL